MVVPTKNQILQLMAVLDSSGKFPMGQFQACCGGSQHLRRYNILDSDDISDIVLTDFSKHILPCKSDLDCPVTVFTEFDFESILGMQSGVPGLTEAKLIAKLKDGRYAFLKTWQYYSEYYSAAIVSRDLTGLYLFSLSKDERLSLGIDALGITGIID